MKKLLLGILLITSFASYGQYSVPTLRTKAIDSVKNMPLNSSLRQYNMFHAMIYSYLNRTNNLSDLVSISTARTNLGATTLGGNLFTATNPSAITFLRINADNTIATRSAAQMISDLGAQTALVSGTSIKTINSTSLLGSGNIALAAPPFLDNTALISNSSDATKQLIISTANIGTGTVRVAAFPDANINVARSDAGQTFTGIQNFSSAPTLTTSSTSGYVWTATDGIGNGGWAAPSGGGVSSVSGTANRIAVAGTTTPSIDISTSYVGQATITTLGTITTGTMGSGSKILLGSDATGDLHYNSGSGTLARSSTLNWNNTQGTLLIGNIKISRGDAPSNNNLYIGTTLGNLTDLNVEKNVMIGDNMSTTMTTGASNNTAIGYFPMQSCTTCSKNFFVGEGAGASLTVGSSNIGFGHHADYLITGSNSNIALGQFAFDDLAGAGNSGNIRIGGNAAANSLGYTSGSNSVFIGFSLTSPSATESGQLVIQNAIFGRNNTATGSSISTGNVGIYINSPTARLHLPAGTATAGTASLKIPTGVLLTTTEAGAFENDGTHVYFTFANSGTRQQLDQQAGGALTLTGDATGSGTGTFATSVVKIKGNTVPVNASGALTNDGAGNLSWTPAGGSGTVTSIAVSGGSTGLTTSGGPVTTSGTITLAGTLGAGFGGTGLATYTAGDLLTATATTTIGKVGIGSNGDVLTVVSGAPAWSAPTTAGWALTGTSTLTGVATITSNTASRHIFTGTWTASANNQFHANFTGTFTATGTGSDNLYGYRFTPTLVLAGTSQTGVGVDITTAMSGGTSSPVYTAFRVTSNTTSGSHNAFVIRDSGGASLFTVNDAGGVTGKSGVTWSIGSGTLTHNTWGAGSNNTQFIINAPNNDSNGVLIQSNGSAPTIGQNLLKLTGGITANSGTPNHTSLSIVPVINMTGSTSNITGINYNPTLTSVTGVTLYGFISTPTASLSGFGTATPTSTVHVSGSFAVGYVAKTANYTLTSTDHFIDCTSNSFTVTLPTAVGITGREYIVKNSGTATTITLATTSSQTVDGSAPGTIAATLVPMRLISDGANWKTF